MQLFTEPIAFHPRQLLSHTGVRTHPAPYQLCAMHSIAYMAIISAHVVYHTYLVGYIRKTVTLPQSATLMSGTTPSLYCYSTIHTLPGTTAQLYAQHNPFLAEHQPFNTNHVLPLLKTFKLDHKSYGTTSVPRVIGTKLSFILLVNAFCQ